VDSRSSSQNEKNEEGIESLFLQGSLRRRSSCPRVSELLPGQSARQNGKQRLVTVLFPFPFPFEVLVSSRIQSSSSSSFLRPAIEPPSDLPSLSTPSSTSRPLPFASLGTTSRSPQPTSTPSPNNLDYSIKSAADSRIHSTITLRLY
jgi:hypothetical protein